MGLKAKVTVVMMVEGERKTFEPGNPLPDMNKHDVEALKAMGAIEDEADVAAESKAAAVAKKATATEFAEAKKTVKAAQESIAPAEPLDPPAP